MWLSINILKIINSLIEADNMSKIPENSMLMICAFLIPKS